MPLQTATCPLCSGQAKLAYLNKYFMCANCQGIFLDDTWFLEPAEEKRRYQTHNNDINDPGYQRFVDPIVQSVRKQHSSTDRGLDFGAGTGPVIIKLLADQGYTISPYDPFFHDYPELLASTYDYIVCCEVIEHFRQPYQEFQLLKKLLNPGGHLYCMTLLFSPGIDFEDWFYKNDPTHVFFYQPETCSWIQKQWRFVSCSIDQRLITFTN